MQQHYHKPIVSASNTAQFMTQSLTRGVCGCGEGKWSCSLLKRECSEHTTPGPQLKPFQLCAKETTPNVLQTQEGAVRGGKEVEVMQTELTVKSSFNKMCSDSGGTNFYTAERHLVADEAKVPFRTRCFLKLRMDFRTFYLQPHKVTPLLPFHHGLSQVRWAEKQKVTSAAHTPQPEVCYSRFLENTTPRKEK